jgi:predicted MFS family arabinose efflux permease
LFGTYNTIATLAGSFGALAAIGTGWIDVEPQRFLLVYPLAAAAAIAVAAGLGSTVESRRSEPAQPRRPLERSRGIVARLGGLFALDSFGGGFVTQAFLAYWFTERWGTSAATLGVVFFAIGFLQAGSFQVAVRLAGRVGLLNTMVFTHLPSNLLLALIPFAPSQRIAIALVFGRFALSQMDVPTRQAYVVAVVDPDERTAAAAYTNTARYIVRPLGPLVAGPILTVSLGAPFVIAGALKSVYDVGLYALFRETKLPNSAD